MQKRRKINTIAKCIRCNEKDSMVDSCFCEECAKIKCRRTACNNTVAIHQHKYNKDWYCIECAKLINEANDMYKEERCFDIF